jgi:hypothetical protein
MIRAADFLFLIGASTAALFAFALCVALVSL